MAENNIRLTPAGAVGCRLIPEDVIALALSTYCKQVHGRWAYLDEISNAPIDALLWLADPRHPFGTDGEINPELAKLLEGWPAGTQSEG